MNIKKPIPHLELLEKIESEYQDAIKSIVKNGDSFILEFNEQEAAAKIEKTKAKTEQFIALCNEYRAIFKKTGLAQSVDEIEKLVSLGDNVVSEMIKKKSLVDSNAELKTSSSHSIKIDKLIEITNFPESVEKLIQHINDFSLNKNDDISIKDFIAIKSDQLVVEVPEAFIEKAYSENTTSIPYEKVAEFLTRRKLCVSLNEMVNRKRGIQSYPDLDPFRGMIDLSALHKVDPNYFAGYKPDLTDLAIKSRSPHRLKVI